MMKHWITTWGFLLIIWKNISFCCPVLPHNNINCTCNKSNITDQETLTLYCFDVNDDGIFSIDHSQTGLLQISCMAGDPYGTEIFQTERWTSARIVEFTYCNFPDVSFGHILKGMNVTELVFKSKTKTSTLASFMFHELSYLEKLTISGNGIELLPADIFRNLQNLEFIDMSDNKLMTLHEETFANLNNLTEIHLRGNFLSYLPPKLFTNLFRLKKLVLSNNKLNKLPNLVFKDLILLENLQMLRNQLNELPLDIFLHNNQLKNLDISQNSLNELPLTLLHNCNRLVFLDISFNPLSSVPDGLLKYLNSLRHIELNECNVTIPTTFFANAPNLLKISMYNNRLQTLTPELFGGNKQLKELDMSYNDILTLENSPFQNNDEMEILVLYKNNLNNISANAFEGLDSLRRLNISSNFIKKIEANTFDNLQKLEALNISNNAISALLGDNPFGFSRQLKVIDVSENEILEFPNIQWNNHLFLKEFKASHNKISHLTVPYMLSWKTKIYLQFNNISTLDIDILQKVDDTQTVNNEDSPIFYLENNPFTCDCHMFEFYKYITEDTAESHSAQFNDAHKLTCYNPLNLRGEKLKYLGMSDFTCNVTESCPESCACFYRKCDHSMIVNCSGRHLNEIPKTVPKHTNILHLENNNIRSFQGFDAQHWENLTHLYLDNNSLSSANWYIPQTVKVLSLSNNKLTYLPNIIERQAESIPRFRINLANNSWQCNCSTQKLKLWLSEHFNQVKDINKIFCQKELANGTHSSYLLMRLSDDELCPTNRWTQKMQLLIYISSCVIVAIIIFLLLVFYYRNKQTVLAFIYIHFHPVFDFFFNYDELDEDKLFDGFVSYSSADRDVAFALIEELEKKKPHYRLCIHERDWLPGDLITCNIVHSVQNSKKTILVLSKDFLNSVWFHVEFHTAYYQMLEDKINRLIVIVKGELPPKDTLDKDLQYLLSTKTYLVWGERWFSEKLRYAMPRSKTKPKAPVQKRIKLHPKLLKKAEDQMSLVYSGDYTNTRLENNLIEVRSNSASNNVVSETINYDNVSAM